MAIFEVMVRHHCQLLLFTELMNDPVANVLEAHKSLKLQCDGLLEGICFVFLLVGVKIFGNDHTPGGEGIALNQHAPQLEALGLESGFFAFWGSETAKDLSDEVWVHVCV